MNIKTMMVGLLLGATIGASASESLASCWSQFQCTSRDNCDSARAQARACEEFEMLQRPMEMERQRQQSLRQFNAEMDAIRKSIQANKVLRGFGTGSQTAR